MSLNNNLVITRIEQRDAAFTSFRDMYDRLDTLIEALYRPGLYTCAEFDRMAGEYRMLQQRADRLETTIRKNFPAKDLESTIKWMKSFPKDDLLGKHTDLECSDAQKKERERPPL